MKKKLSKILTSFLEVADSLTITVRDEYEHSISIQHILNTLSPYLITKISNVSEWPGTVLLLGTATVYKYCFSESLISKLVEIKDDLYGWVSPDYPEDIVVYYKENPLFVSITHERDSYYT